jgi:hypothetical protein
VQVRAREQRVVVEHLLEVRDDPPRVDAVAGEPAADLVVHAAGRHPAQRVQRHLALSRRSRNSITDACGNFGAPPQPPSSAS